MIVDPYHGEVAFRIDKEREIVLRLSWGAVSAIAAAWKPEVEKLKSASPPGVEVDWGGVIDLAFREYDMPKIAFFLECAAAGHHPEITAKDFMEASPAHHVTLGVARDLISLFFWGPNGPPEAQKSSPFALVTLLSTLSKLRPRTA